MFLNDTPFYKDTRVWRQKFIETLSEHPRKWWDAIELDIDSMVDKTYVLHLPHRTDKVKWLKERLSEVKTPKSTLLDSVTLWEGSYGKKEWDPKIHTSNYSFQYCWSLDPEPALYDNLGRTPTTDELNDIIIESSTAESNIALGHAGILQDIVNNNLKSALILEDDVQFSVGFAWLMNKMFKELPEDWDLFYVSYQPCMYGFKSEPFNEDIVKVEQGVWWLSGVFISQRAAQKLIDNFPIIGPIDVWINHHFSELNVYATKYNCISQNTRLSSDNTHSYKEALKNIAELMGGTPWQSWK